MPQIPVNALVPLQKGGMEQVNKPLQKGELAELHADLCKRVSERQ